MRRILPVLMLLSLALGACLPKSKQWVHPREPDPRKEDKLFGADTAFCEGKLGPGQQGDSRDAAMAECLKRLGWKRKE